jgi:translation initiation factor 5B
VDIPQEVVKVVRESDMGDDIKDVLEDIIKIKRKEDAFWGTRYV